MPRPCLRLPKASKLIVTYRTERGAANGTNSNVKEILKRVARDNMRNPLGTLHARSSWKA